MTYKLTLDRKPTYLHAVVTGSNSEENVARYLEQIRDECATRNCSSVLVEERLEGPRLRTTQVFQIAAEGSVKARGTIRAIAYVDVHAEGDAMQFAETVARNRGLPITVFPTVAEAEIWLLSKNRAGA